MVPRNLLFLSGPHGSGKTTLVQKLCEEDATFVAPSLTAKTIKLDHEPFPRQILKGAQRLLENFEYVKIAEQRPNEIILGNRCIYDVLAYNAAFCAAGWISSSEQASLDQTLCSQYSVLGMHQPLSLIVNPPLDVLVHHLEQRWMSTEKKWREHDLKYLRAVHDAYRVFEGREEVYYLNHEADLEKDLAPLRDWVYDRAGFVSSKSI